MAEIERKHAEIVNVLRRLWCEAIADDSEGLDPDRVFYLLEAKYEGLHAA
jgi:hypothetical protein